MTAKEDKPTKLRTLLIMGGGGRGGGNIPDLWALINVEAQKISTIRVKIPPISMQQQLELSFCTAYQFSFVHTLKKQFAGIRRPFVSQCNSIETSSGNERNFKLARNRRFEKTNSRCVNSREDVSQWRFVLNF